MVTVHCSYVGSKSTRNIAHCDRRCRSPHPAGKVGSPKTGKKCKKLFLAKGLDRGLVAYRKLGPKSSGKPSLLVHQNKCFWQCEISLELKVVISWMNILPRALSRVSMKHFVRYTISSWNSCDSVTQKVWSHFLNHPLLFAHCGHCPSSACLESDNVISQAPTCARLLPQFTCNYDAATQPTTCSLVSKSSEISII